MKQRAIVAGAVLALSSPLLVGGLAHAEQQGKQEIDLKIEASVDNTKITKVGDKLSYKVKVTNVGKVDVPENQIAFLADDDTGSVACDAQFKGYYCNDKTDGDGVFFAYSADGSKMVKPNESREFSIEGTVKNLPAGAEQKVIFDIALATENGVRVPGASDKYEQVNEDNDEAELTLQVVAAADDKDNKPADNNNPAAPQPAQPADKDKQDKKAEENKKDEKEADKADKKNATELEKVAVEAVNNPQADKQPANKANDPAAQPAQTLADTGMNILLIAGGIVAVVGASVGIFLLLHKRAQARK
ncbi:hypothetical protein HG444_003295 [Candidatus Saccharibacteria bacterium]|nr:hypothetical protein [Candidatus Saccharibacteria bacterium]